jgi:UDP-N-acetylmuramoyl-L-alanyl-D-glutamate--2,6-diaminopimelate ligase
MSELADRKHADTRAHPLAQLVEGLVPVPGDVMVSELTLDSRAVVPGALFLACQGRTHHGLAFAAQAIAAGARAVLYESGAGVEPPPAHPGVLIAPVPHLSRRVGLIASRFFGTPARALHIAGITGTNGKTTSAWLLAQALKRLERPAAYLGTLGFGIPPALTATEHTTPDAVSVHRCLASARSLGAGFIAMEVSSHAIDQERIAGVRFETAAFTNLTRDHLDYHGTMEAYGAAKSRLLAWPALEHRIVNVDDPFGAQLAAQPSPARLTVTTRNPECVSTFRHARFVRAAAVTATSQGLAIEIDSSWGRAVLAARLIGGFNVDNLLTVLGMLLSFRIPLEEAVVALEGCQAACGRMEVFGGQGALPLAVVDYAHTPDALAKAISATRAHCPGRLHVVFGCGGDRDSGKRSAMGAIAAELADELTLTDDNPRSEDPAHIIGQILEGIAHPTALYIEHDRELAIRRALARSSRGDAVLIAGKGHENYQIYGSTRRSFSDQAVVCAALETLRS